MILVESEVHERQQRLPPRRLVHRAGGIPDLETAGAEPFEIARLLAVERRREQRRGMGLRRRRRARRDVADEQLVRHRLVHQPIGVPEVPPEEVIEFEIVGG